MDHALFLPLCETKALVLHPTCNKNVCRGLQRQCRETTLLHEDIPVMHVEHVVEAVCLLLHGMKIDLPSTENLVQYS